MKKPVIVVALLVIVGLGGYLAYNNLFSTEADEEFTLESATTGSTAKDGGTGESVGSGDDALASLSGTWTVGATSEAGYRILEDTPTGEKTVTGRTGSVTGSITLDDGELTATDVVVDLASVASDQPLRDTAFRDSIMRTSEFPTATFRQSDAVAIPDGAATEPISVEVAGTLEMRGSQQPASATIEAVTDGASITVVGQIDVRLADFAIDPPAIPGLVTVRDAGTIEFKLVLTKS